MKPTTALFSLALILSSACTNSAVDPNSATPALSSLEPQDFIARAIAVAMGHEPTRLAVRNAMRASPWTEHKLLLQEFLKRREGELLLSSAEREGIDRQEFLSKLGALPSIQFYVPAHQQRLTWTGTGDLAVSANLETGEPTEAYLPSGASLPLHLDRGELPAGALFVLQRAEPMHYRVQSQANTPGSVIQDSNDRDFGGALIIRNAGGRIIRTIEFADLRTHRIAYECGPEAFVCDEYSSGGLNSGLYLTQLVNNGVCDNLCIFETLEFEFRTTAQYNPTQQISAQLTGIGQYDAWNGDFIISSYRPWNQWVEVGVWETDGTSGDDPFECQQFGPNWGSCPQFLPRVLVNPGGTMSFALCQGLPWTCSNAPSDLEVTFKDRP